MRRMLARMGEPAEIAWRRRTLRPRRVVLLLDVGAEGALGVVLNRPSLVPVATPASRARSPSSRKSVSGGCRPSGSFAGWKRLC